MTDLHTNIMIFYTPRSGSTVLLECMEQAKVFGRAPAFHVGDGELLKTDFVDNAQQWIDDYSHNGVVVGKVPMNYLDRIVRRTRADPVCEFLNSFTHFIVLGRKDVVAQAVSWHVASETASFTSKVADKKEGQVPYNYGKILWYYSVCYGMHLRGKIFAHGSGKPELNLYYEDFENDLTGTVRRIAEWAEIEIDPDYQANPLHQKQHNPLKVEFIERFNKEYLIDG